MKPYTVLEALFSKHPDSMSREIYQEHIEKCPHCKADEAVLRDFIAVLRETDSLSQARAAESGKPGQADRQRDPAEPARTTPGGRPPSRRVFAALR
jgi:hypothetical protein